MASLGAEIAAARLLAPWFGASTIVWANTIATVLVALSIGYAIGGRLADRNPTLAGLSRWVLLASVLLALVPFVSGPFLRLSVEAFEQLSGGLFVGSLVGVGVLIAVPVLLLGMVSPYAVRLKVDHVEDAGRVAGRLYAIGTIGSLTGTFLASLLLIPLVGSRRTFLIFALALALVVLPALGKRWLVGAAVAALIIGLIAIPVGSTKTVTNGGKVIWERETEYQYARVIEDPDGDRVLELNEGQAVHSVYSKDRYLMGGYWDSMTVLSLAGQRSPTRVVNLGSAAGTVARGLTHYFPDDQGRRRGDRSRRHGGGSQALRHAREEHHHPHCRRAALAAGPEQDLRLDPGRRLPPALHPLLPHHPGVLRRRPRPPGPGRNGVGQRRPRAGLRRSREGPHGDDACFLRRRAGMA